MAKVLLRASQPSGPAASSSAAPSAPAKPPSTGPHKLLADNLELQLEEAGKQLSDSNDFTVIGVLGGQGVGKSTIMSLLAGAAWDDRNGPAGLSEPPFAPQSRDVVLHAAHQTSGVDLYVTGERLLLLDTQPLLSPSVLLELQQRETSLPNDVQTHENLLELQALRLAMLVLSTCHMVICVHDVQLDPLSLRVLRIAAMLCHRLPDVSSLATATPQAVQAMIASVAAPASGFDAERYAEPLPVVEYHPKLAFVFNRMPSGAFVPSQQAALRQVLGRLFASSFSESVLAHDYAAGTDADAAPAEALPPDPCVPLVLLLPENDETRVTATHAGFRTEANSVRDALLSQRRTPFAKTLTEREWLRGVGRMWEAIHKSACLADYNRALQKLHLFA